ncbi:MAG: hypothetical protein J1E39_03810 [Eubacterium sp.]|nr:hypothetical protein [Eubacterium sp.]
MNNAGKIKETIKITVVSIWQAIISFFRPLAWQWIFLGLTGHMFTANSYDMLAEPDGKSIAFGIFYLLVWVAVALPGEVYLIYKICHTDKVYFVIFILATLLLFVCGAGNLEGYLSTFGINI